VETARGLIRVRPADLAGPDARAVSLLVEAYLLQTEFEKSTHLGGSDVGTDLPGRYRDEVASPARAYENAVGYLAELDETPVGVTVVQQNTTTREIKRVWVDPRARGQRVGSALMDAALGQQDQPIRLTVWDWRDDAVSLYVRRGFVAVAPWDSRTRLLCMERPGVPAVSAQP
jgi:GNAT superfamily N-acetyltransferase